MRRVELIEGVNEILKAVQESGLRLASRALLTATKERDWSLNMVKALRNYTIKASAFSPAARDLTHVFHLLYLEDAEVWAQLLDTEKKDRRVITSIRNDVNFIHNYLPKISKMITPASLALVKEEESGLKYKDKDVLSIIVIEDKDRLSSPERIIEVLDSVGTLYKACALMNGVPPEGLSVISCDSGSDKSFDFLGAAKVIECLKEFILSLWDRVVFFREKQVEQRIELVNKSLPLYERLGDLVKEKKLAPEMAEIIRRDVFEATGKFIKSGASIPELKAVSHYDPRALMAPEPKLLVSAPDAPSGDTEQPEAKGGEGVRAEVEPTRDSPSELNFDNLEDAERSTLIKLLEKARGNNLQDTLADEGEADADMASSEY